MSRFTEPRAWAGTTLKYASRFPLARAQLVNGFGIVAKLSEEKTRKTGALQWRTGVIVIVKWLLSTCTGFQTGHLHILNLNPTHTKSSRHPAVSVRSRGMLVANRSAFGRHNINLALWERAFTAAHTHPVRNWVTLAHVFAVSRAFRLTNKKRNGYHFFSFGK